MRNSTVLVTAATLLLAATAAGHAGTLAGGPLFNGPVTGFNFATCALFNAGSTAVDVSSIAIVDQNGTAIHITRQKSCSPNLQPGHSCNVQGHVSLNNSYSCEATVSHDTLIHGSLALGTSGAATAVVLPLQPAN